MSRKLGCGWGRISLEGVLTYPISLHRYAYTHQNPVTYYDENGNVIPLVVAAAIVGAGEQVLSTYLGDVVDNVIYGIDFSDKNDDPISDIKNIEDKWLSILKTDKSFMHYTAQALAGAIGGEVTLIAGPGIGSGIQEAIGGYTDRVFDNNDYELNFDEISYDYAIGHSTFGLSRIIEPKILNKLRSYAVGFGPR
jgi:hypothetical protein